MEGDRFDALTKTLTTTPRSRRQTLTGLALGALALLTGEAEAKQHRHRQAHHGQGSGSTHAAAPPPNKPGKPNTPPTGRCQNGFSNCRGKCVDVSQDRNNCGACATICPEGQVCTGGSCCTPQTADQACGSRTCGSVPDSCGGTVSCGSCPSGTTCSSDGTNCCQTAATACGALKCGTVVNNCGDTVDCSTRCTSVGGICLSNRTCTFDCEFTSSGTTCPSTCAQGTCYFFNTEGQAACPPAGFAGGCPSSPIACNTTEDCPRGSECLDTTGGCTPSRLCVPVCTG